MKKILAFTIMAAMAGTASAQFWTGTSMGMDIQDVEDDDNVTTLSIAPEMGYNFRTNMAIAVALSYSHSNATRTTNAFNVHPYLRYTYSRMGPVSFFLDAGVSYGLSHVRGDDDNTQSLGVSLNPGMAYALGDRMSLVAHMGDIGYTHRWYDDSTSNTFRLSMTNKISFGLFCYF